MIPARSKESPSQSDTFCCPQMVDRLDEGLVPLSVGANSYPLLHDLVARAIFRTHVEGKLKVIPPPHRD